MKNAIIVSLILVAFIFVPSCKPVDPVDLLPSYRRCPFYKWKDWQLSRVKGANCIKIGTGFNPNVETRVSLPQQFDYSRIDDLDYQNSICEGYGVFDYYICE